MCKGGLAKAVFTENPYGQAFCGISDNAKRKRSSRISISLTEIIIWKKHEIEKSCHNGS